jgi:hypothetical protein
LWEPKIATLVNIDEHARTLALVAVGYNRIGKVGSFISFKITSSARYNSKGKPVGRGSKTIEQSP